MHTANIAGPGDILPSHVAPPHDPRYAESDDYAELREVAIEELFQERMSSDIWVSDAQGSFTDEEYALLTAALVASDVTGAGETAIHAVQRVIRAGAERDVDMYIEKSRRDGEADAAAARMEN